VVVVWWVVVRVRRPISLDGEREVERSRRMLAGVRTQHEVSCRSADQDFTRDSTLHPTTPPLYTRT